MYFVFDGYQGYRFQVLLMFADNGLAAGMGLDLGLQQRYTRFCGLGRSLVPCGSHVQEAVCPRKVKNGSSLFGCFSAIVDLFPLLACLWKVVVKKGSSLASCSTRDSYFRTWDLSRHFLT